MTDKKTEALKLALESLENLPEMCGIEEAITAIREALTEQPAQQQEPVAWYHAEKYKTHFTSIPSEDLIESGYWKPLYTPPPANANAGKTWVGLTDDERADVADISDCFEEVVDATEAKLKEKNT